MASRPDLPEGHAAVLLLTPDQKAAAAASALESAGVPFTITRDPQAAARHRLIIIPFGEASLPLTRPMLERMRRFLGSGGILVVQAPSSKDPWAELTGLARSEASQQRRKIVFE